MLNLNGSDLSKQVEFRERLEATRNPADPIGYAEVLSAWGDWLVGILDADCQYYDDGTLRHLGLPATAARLALRAASTPHNPHAADVLDELTAQAPVIVANAKINAFQRTPQQRAAQLEAHAVVTAGFRAIGDAGRKCN